MNANLYNSLVRQAHARCAEFHRQYEPGDMAHVVYWSTRLETPGAAAIHIEMTHGGKLSCRAIEWLMTAKGSEIKRLIARLDKMADQSQYAMRRAIEQATQ